jgi:hypothetical protein
MGPIERASICLQTPTKATPIRFIKPTQHKLPMGQASSFYWTHLSMLHLKTESESSLRNVQNCDSYINIP